jgi:hypothetical protein
MTYRYDFDSTRAGDFRLSRADFLIVQEAYRLLSKELDQWNQRALEHGAVKPPYEEEVKDINHMIEWSEAEAAKSGNWGVTINSVSVGSLRYMKAALMLMVSKREADYAEKARAGWPSAPLKALTDSLVNVKAIAADIRYEPCDVLWELAPRETSVSRQDSGNSIDWDVFVSHASEDKEEFVRPLVQGLQGAGLKVWFDEFSLKVGDSLRRSIDRGLASSRFGVVVISPDFLRKEWPQRELDGLVSREIDGVNVILPVWHRIGAAKIRAYSPTLADKVATSSDDGLERVIFELLRVIDPDSQSIKRPAGPSERSAKISQETLDRYRSKVSAGVAEPSLSSMRLAALAPPATSENPRDEIRFDYLPDSPLSHGWRSAGWAKHPIPADASWKAAPHGGMVMELSDIYCPIVYEVGSKAALSTRLVCDLRFSTGAELFVVIRLLTRDGSGNRDCGIKFELSRRQPYYTKQYDEWVLPIDPPSLGNGWYHLDISLTDAVGRTWGQAGWTLSELLRIRLRGHLAISPIQLK